MQMTSYLTDIWQTFKEVDLRPLRLQATNPVLIAVVGSAKSGYQKLAEQLQRDPSKPSESVPSHVFTANINSIDEVIQADLIILVIEKNKKETSKEQNLIKQWHYDGKSVLIFFNQEIETTRQASQIVNTKGIVYGNVEDTHFLQNTLTKAICSLMPARMLSLGRHYPLLRSYITKRLINDTCTSNAAYALSTGLAEIIPIFDIPVAVADMVVLSKNQAYLVYKLGLVLGYSTQWRDYIVEFGGVLGSSFGWRQLARTLVGWIPVWGILPKVGVAYAGTYVVGQVVLQWYLTGKHITRQQMKLLYREAFEKGKDIARHLVTKVSRPKLPEQSGATPRKSASKKTGRWRRKVRCPDCGHKNETHAKYCSQCGQELLPSLSEPIVNQD